MIAFLLARALTCWATVSFRLAFRFHLTTDPACTHHRPPKAGSWLDRASRGWPCHVCNTSLSTEEDS